MVTGLAWEDEFCSLRTVTGLPCSLPKKSNDVPWEPAEVSEKQMLLDPLQAKDRLRITQYQHNSTLPTALQVLRSGSWAKAVTPVCIAALLLLPSNFPHDPSVQTALKQETARQAGESELRSTVWRDGMNTLYFSNTSHPQHFRDIHSTSTLQTTEVISAQVEMGK